MPAVNHSQASPARPGVLCPISNAQAIVEVLRARGEVTAAEIAAALQWLVDTVRYWLRPLKEDQQVEATHAHARSKSQAYRLVNGDSAQPPPAEPA